MILQQFIDKTALIGKQVSSTNIPVFINNTYGTIADIQLLQGNNGKYYVNIDTFKRYYATSIEVPLNPDTIKRI